jgi:hypothetical protein
MRKRLKVGGWEGGKVRMGNAEKIEGEILGRWEGENGECGSGNAEFGRWNVSIADLGLSKWLIKMIG